MANLTEDEIKKMLADEAERCALLAEALAKRWERSAAKIRDQGTYYVRALWPPFKRIKCVTPRWEQAAKDTEAAAHGLRTIARGAREGWDPRKLKDGDPDKPVSARPPGACYCDLDDAACREAGHYKPILRDDALDGGAIWEPCPQCTEPMNCGSWRTCKNRPAAKVCGTCHKPGCDL